MASSRSRLQTWRIYFLAGVLPALCGLSVIGLEARHYLHQRWFLMHALHGMGKIVGNEVSTVFHKNSPSTKHYTVIFAYADDAGKTWTVTDQSSEYTLVPVQVGRRCPIRYNPDNPAEAQLELPPDDFWNTGGDALYLGGLGAVFTACGIWTLRRYHADFWRRRAA